MRSLLLPRKKMDLLGVELISVYLGRWVTGIY